MAALTFSIHFHEAPRIALPTSDRKTMSIHGLVRASRTLGFVVGVHRVKKNVRIEGDAATHIEGQTVRSWRASRLPLKVHPSLEARP